ncbi:MAG: antibiotic biosynthesis monooxygenase [Actinobacteria bacterium]|nr:antibiotic biosynthesis monooxygenase [Actinomycetota bacterium]
MSKVAAIAKLTAAEGQRDALVKVMEQLVDAAADEAGTELYVLNLDTAEVDVVWFFELYSDSDALAAHGQSDTMKAITGQLGGLVAGRPELHFLTPHRAAGITL